MTKEAVAKVIKMAPDFDPWPQPEPLVAATESPAPYPLAALPPTIGDAVIDYHGYGQQPVPLIACSALAASSLAAQGLADVARDDVLIGPISLNIAVVGVSGERKTSADRIFGRAAREWQSKRREEMAGEVEAAKSKKVAHAAECEGLVAKIRANAGKQARAEVVDLDKMKSDLCALQSAAPVEPIVPRLHYEDVNAESLAQSIALGWPSSSLWSDEGGLIVGSRGMGDEGLMRFLGLLNRLWDGLPFERDRTVAKSFAIRGRRFTSNIMAQPDVMGRLLKAGSGLSRGTGFLARFLVAWPESTMGTRLYVPPASLSRMARFDARITELLDHPLPIDDSDMVLKPPVLRLDAPAFPVWTDYFNSVEAQIGKAGDYLDVPDFAAKSADNAARLAAIFHIVERGPAGSIDAETMERGCAVAAWHLHEAKRLMGRADVPQALSDARTLLAWMLEKGGKVPLVSILNAGPAALREKKRRDAAVERLIETGNARVGKEGRTDVLTINPKVG